MDPTSNFSEILSSLMSNPKVSELISDITSKTQTVGESTASAAESHPPEKEKSAESGGISIPPEILANLPQMMSALSGLGIGPSPSSEEKSPSQKKDISISRDSQRKALLCALKPYLSEKRCAVIDGLLQFESFSHIFSALYSSK